jgi:hypothetical protein
MMAGPSITSPGRRSSRTTSAASCQAGARLVPAVYMRTVSRRGTSRGGCTAWRGSDGGIAGHHGLDRHGLHHQRLALHQERKALAVGVLERLRDLVHHGLVRRPALQVRKRHDQRRIGAVVAHVHAAVHATVARLTSCWRQLGCAPAPASPSVSRSAVMCSGASVQLHRRLAHHVLVGQAHAVGRQHAGQRVHQHARHAQASATRQACWPPAPPKHCRCSASRRSRAPR